MARRMAVRLGGCSPCREWTPLSRLLRSVNVLRRDWPDATGWDYAGIESRERYASTSIRTPCGQCSLFSRQCVLTSAPTATTTITMATTMPPRIIKSLSTLPSSLEIHFSVPVFPTATPLQTTTQTTSPYPLWIAAAREPEPEPDGMPHRQTHRAPVSAGQVLLPGPMAQLHLSPRYLGPRAAHRRRADRGVAAQAREGGGAAAQACGGARAPRDPASGWFRLPCIGHG